MKNLFKLFLIVAGVATASVSCSKNDEGALANPDTHNLKTYHFTTSATTRTAFSENTVGTGGTFVWNNEVDNCFTFVNLSNASVAPSTSFVCEDGVAKVKATLTPGGQYSSVYPVGCVVNDNKNVEEYKLILSTTQSNVLIGTQSSFDPAADILVAKTFVAPEDNTDFIPLKLKRLVAIGRLQIVGLNSEEQIQSVKFEAAGKTLTGRFKVNLNTGETGSYGYYGANSSVEVGCTAVENMAIDGEVAYPIWFNCFPVTLNTDDNYTITVTTETKRFVKSGTIGANPLVFTEGHITAFKANFTSIEGVDLEEPVQDGVDKLVAASFGLSGSQNEYVDKTYASTDIDGVSYSANLSVNDGAIQLRSKNNNSGIVTTINTNRYGVSKVVVVWASNTSGRKIDVYGSYTAYNNPSDLYNTDTAGQLVGTLNYSNETTLEFQTPYPYVGIRSNDNALYVQSISIEYGDAVTTILPLKTPVISEASLTLAGELNATWSGDTNAASYEWRLKNSQDVQIATGEVNATSLNNESVTAEITAGNYTLEVKAKAAANSTEWEDSAWSAPKDITVVDPNAGGTYYVKVTSSADDWSGTYLLVYDQGDENKYLTGISTTSTKYGMVENVTISDTGIAQSANVDAHQCIIEKISGQTNQYTIYLNNVGYLGWSSSNSLRSQSAATADSEKWTIAFDSTSHYFVFSNVKDSSRQIFYNTGSPRFACYTGKSNSDSGYACPSLYKLGN